MGSCAAKNQRIVVDGHLARDGSTHASVLDVKGSRDDLIFSASSFVTEKAGNIERTYKIGTTLGTGAYGLVKKVTHRPTGAIRAMKIINKGSMSREEEVNKFLNEISILKTLDHPNILKMYEFYQDHKNYYLITELCTGGELFDKIISLRYLTEEMAAETMYQILSAIAYCHDRNIVHRDLKPENLLLESNAENAPLKVIDFGTSTIFEPKRKMNQKHGTPYYIAPEVLKRKYTEKCDVWSCGVILYVLLCGYPPFGGSTEEKILSQVAKGKVKFEGPEWNIISFEAKNLIARLMAYNPNDRISAREALNDPWIQTRIKKLSLDQPVAVTTLDNLRSFRATTQLQKATLTYIASQLSTKEERTQLLKTFQALDCDNDGKLTLTELIEGYKISLKNDEQAQDVATKIMDEVDTDKSGFIDYSEFIIATINPHSLVTDTKLKIAFQLFDKDGSGTITPEELKAILGQSGNLSDEVWEQIVADVDDNGDGEISFTEFKEMMTKNMSL